MAMLSSLHVPGCLCSSARENKGKRRHDTQHNDTQYKDIQHNDTQHNSTSATREKVILLSVVIYFFVMLNVVKLSVIMESVAKLRVIMLSVAAPWKQTNDSGFVPQASPDKILLSSMQGDQIGRNFAIWAIFYGIGQIFF